jgi:hypothetical protein
LAKPTENRMGQAGEVRCAGERGPRIGGADDYGARMAVSARISRPIECSESDSDLTARLNETPVEAKLMSQQRFVSWCSCAAVEPPMNRARGIEDTARKPHCHSGAILSVRLQSKQLSYSASWVIAAKWRLRFVV